MSWGGRLCQGVEVNGGGVGKVVKEEGGGGRSRKLSQVGVSIHIDGRNTSFT